MYIYIYIYMYLDYIRFKQNKYSKKQICMQTWVHIKTQMHRFI